MEGMTTSLQTWYCLSWLSCILGAVLASSDEGSVTSGQGVMRDYCQWEVFEAQCGPGEVVEMLTAFNGRMTHTRCIERDYGYVGCKEDVLYLADQRCSGRRECKVEIPDKAFDRAFDATTPPCPRDLQRYFRASYKCVKVQWPVQHECVGNTAVRVTLPSGHIASVTTVDTTCGSTETPWLIDARPGQTVNLTLYDFSGKAAPAAIPAAAGLGHGMPQVRGVLGAGGGGAASPTQPPPGACQVYCIVKDLLTGHSTTVCSATNRISSVTVPRGGGALELRVLPGSGDKTRYFLVAYEVTGCANMDDPTDGRAMRSDDVITVVRCTSTQHTWKLTCDGNNWVGPKPQCSPAGQDSEYIGVGYDAARFARTASLLTIIAIATVIGVLIFILGLCCFRRCHRRSAGRSSDPPRTYSCPSADVYREVKADFQHYNVTIASSPSRHHGLVQSLQPKPGAGQYRSAIHGENDYEAMEDAGGVTVLSGTTPQRCPAYPVPPEYTVPPEYPGEVQDCCGNSVRMGQFKQYPYAAESESGMQAVAVHQVLSGNGGHCYRSELQ